ncbi:MAG: thermonuclease family protein [Geminicoccaceae bacterium]
MRLAPDGNVTLADLLVPNPSVLDVWSDRELTFVPRTGTRDRHGRFLVDGFDEDGVSIAERLLERGDAVLWPAPGVIPLSELTAAERNARDRGAGLWSDPRHAVAAVPAVGFRNRFVIMRGRVIAVAERRVFDYLNFEDDWRNDSSVRIRKSALKRAGETIDTAALAGKKIEVKGFLFEAGGPMIEVSRAHQVRILP